MELFSNVIETINNYLWGIPMIVLLFGTHIFLTLRTGFIQRKTFTGIKLSITRDPDSSGDISQFAALTTALASTIGTGNIIGVGTAIALGGPGAVLWCWLTGVFGIATKYAESLIAVKYRVRTKDGTMLGGAMYALERGLHMKWLAVAFALLGALTSFGIGCGVQVNAISSIINSNVKPALISSSQGMASLIGAYPWLISLTVGIITGAVTCLVIFGGVKSIAKVCEKLVPFMAFFYVAGCLIILIINRAYLGETFSVIFCSAFTEVDSIAGGLVGSGIMMSARYGIARGLFSNESGMGSAPIVAAAAQTRNPVRQALVSATGTFWDTVVVCLLTGLVLVSSIIGQDSIHVASLSGGELTNAAFSLIPYIGQPILIIGIITFAYSTILGWSYYGERCLEYLLGKGGVMPYRLAWIIILIVAPVLKLELVWSIADTLNALMAIPNLVAVLLLSGVVARDTKYYLKHLDETDETVIPVIEDKL
ncbi:alanine/glycine:cation symporter family protein [Lacrimispora sp. 210928-DFI.3.58]|uniref:alanine/glycine:cation symporter family protein n=1 Tax=Lacrimispora sp. 210928-DFI.3.58 TaxID=2883214 RepID=UPI001D082242|nr:alanine/glycine:cation symporter family protein [Lacrimispora sp. 210928-DFI.3.58]MCB7318291.1 alanine:cation symporter family protein [Lacrimispora sp. 210928-DFI.3.58]